MKSYYIWVCAALLLTACDKTELTDPEFDVRVEKAVYKLGDTVKFNFSGYADYLTLYSGETGKKYENRERTRADGTVKLQVNLFLRNVSSQKSLSLLATNDLNPLRDSADVVDAKWTDITDRLTRLPTANTTSGVDAGLLDLTDLKHATKPLFLAWKFKSPNNPTGVQTRWTVTVFTMTNNLPDGTVMALGTVTTFGWKAISVKNKAYAWITTGGLFTNAPAINSGDTENWAVSAPIYPDAILRDYPVSIKDISNVMPLTYQYIYTARGKYKVTFIGSNSRSNDSKTIRKEFEITIE
ncbi:DUF5017 domain-containing protein [Pedobacter nyackensis]|nr:DUF5017 domain-containing protein [Pedobacter nyackensis]